MKKKLFLGLLAAAAVTFTACQKDEVINEVPQDQPIEFGTYVGRDAQTKASVTGLDQMKVDDYTGFGVFAYNTGKYNVSDANTAMNGLTPNFMYHQNVKWDKNSTPDNTSDDTWKYSPLKYWPKDDILINFYAYAPFTDLSTNPAINVTSISTASATGSPTVTFAVSTDVSQQKDLLYANALNQKQSTESSNGVVLNFNHALSRIGFKAKTTEENENQNKVTVKRINISGNFTTSATINLSDGSTDSETKDTDTYELTIKDDPTATGNSAVSLTANEGYIMIIPTNEFVSTSKITITVNYDLQVFDNKIYGEYSAIVNKTETGTISNIEFEKGKAYTIVLTISPSNPIKFSVSSTVNGWDEDVNDDDNINTDDEKPVTVPNA